MAGGQLEPAEARSWRPCWQVLHLDRVCIQEAWLVALFISSKIYFEEQDEEPINLFERLLDMLSHNTDQIHSFHDIDKMTRKKAQYKAQQKAQQKGSRN